MCKGFMIWCYLVLLCSRVDLGFKEDYVIRLMKNYYLDFWR